MAGKTGRTWLHLSPHGTSNRARWHYRQGHKPLRKYCPACADANALMTSIRKETKERHNDSGDG